MSGGEHRRSREEDHARIRLVRHPLWRIRLTREAPRYLLAAMAVSGVVASVRFAVAPPRPAVGSSSKVPSTERDPAAEGYAVLFARRYLTWNGAEPGASARSLAAYAEPGAEAGLGLLPPPTGEQRVEWAEAVQEREPAVGEYVYTIAAETDAVGLLYMTVTVERTSGGGLALVGFPAFVGPPASSPGQPNTAMGEVADGELATVVQRGLRNYLAGAEGELAADLDVRGARERSLDASPARVPSAPGLGKGRSNGARRRSGSRRTWSPVHACLRTRSRARAGPLGDLRRSDRSGQLTPRP